MSDRDRATEVLHALRDAFDASFAELPREQDTSDVAVLAVRVGELPTAIRVHETLSLLKVGPIVAVPSRRPELLGVIGVRGTVTPVYSLARLVGVAESEMPRWAVLAGGPERVALGFATFERHLRVPVRDVHPSAASAAVTHVAGDVQVDGVSRTLLDIPSIVRAITATGAVTGGSST